MSWHKITLNSKECSVRQLETLELSFDALFMAAGCPTDMALFAAPSNDGSLEFYLSPEASILAGELVNAYGGQDCDQPRAEQVELVEGFRKAKQRLCA